LGSSSMAATPQIGFFLESVFQATTTRRVNTAASVILVYDFILTFDDEVQRIWKQTPWSVAKLLWIGHRYLNLINFVVIPMVADAGAQCELNTWFPFFEAIVSQFFISAILSLRCWAFFKGNRVVLGLLASLYLSCLALQVYPTVIGFNLPLNLPTGASTMGDRYTDCLVGSYMAMEVIGMSSWRIAGWVGSIVFDGAVTVLTVFRAFKLRMSGLRIPLLQTMLQDGVVYFGMVVVLNVSMIIAFRSIQCALQLIFQRMTQVLTVVMISHMFLNLKRNGSPAQEEDESHNVTFASIMGRDKTHPTTVSLDPWVLGPKTMSGVVGTLGNDLELSSSSDSQ